MTQPPIGGLATSPDELREAQAATGKVGELLDQAVEQLGVLLGDLGVTGSDE